MLKRTFITLPVRCFSSTPVSFRSTNDTLQDVKLHTSSSMEESMHPKVEEECYTPSDFNTPFWKYTFLCTIGFTILYQWNKNYEKSLKERGQVHPITAYMSYYMADQQESHNKIKEILIQDQVHSAKRLLLVEDKYRPKMPKTIMTGLLESGSPFGISAGSYVDISKVRY